MTKRAIVALSGGMDSATLLAWVLSTESGYYPKLEPPEVLAITFYYDSKHNEQEIKASRRLVDHYKVEGKLIDVDFVFTSSKMKSSLLIDSKLDLPEGNYTPESIKSAVVPGRNLLFLSVLAVVAESLNGADIFIGSHAGDRVVYPDCRPEFISATNEAIRISSDGKVKVRAPFLALDKANVCKTGARLGVPFDKTWTCYKGEELSCGLCSACVSRIEAFTANNLTDPLVYQTQSAQIVKEAKNASTDS